MPKTKPSTRLPSRSTVPAPHPDAVLIALDAELRAALATQKAARERVYNLKLEAFGTDRWPQWAEASRCMHDVFSDTARRLTDDGQAALDKIRGALRDFINQKYGEMEGAKRKVGLHKAEKVMKEAEYAVTRLRGEMLEIRPKMPEGAVILLRVIAEPEDEGNASRDETFEREVLARIVVVLGVAFGQAVAA